MHAAIEQLRTKFSMSPAQWFLFAWLMSGMFCFAVGLGIPYIPSDGATIILIASSLAIGILIVCLEFPLPIFEGKA